MCYSDTNQWECRNPTPVGSCEVAFPVVNSGRSYVHSTLSQQPSSLARSLLSPPGRQVWFLHTLAIDGSPPLHILFSWGTELKVWMKAAEKEIKSHNRWVHFGSGIPYPAACELPVAFIATLILQVLLMHAHKLKANCMCYHRVICTHSECMTKAMYQ